VTHANQLADAVDGPDEVAEVIQRHEASAPSLRSG
jgi:hypothetical protein